MQILLKIRYLIICTIVFPLSIFAQEDEITSHQRPKIGLVLSGGGAKGMAHIGVLKAMEQEGIRPDYIAGTSMGSIIGGLYAIGYSADQLDTIIRQIDWGQVLSNTIPLEYVAYEEKQYYNRYLVELPIVKWKPQLPTGMIQGQMLDEMLTSYTWPSKKYATFDEFPIPFRCIATDVSTGKAIVFKDGSLAKAMRASMAIPTAFTAIDLDTTLVVDGGIVDNFPVEELYKMGAEIVIGVNVAHGFQSAYDIKTMTGILMQVSMISSSEKLKNQIKQCDIYIKPDLKEFNTASFSSSNEILERGYAAGRDFRPKFKELAESIGISKNTSYITPHLEPDSIVIGEITIKGNKLVNTSLIRTNLGIEVGDRVSRHEIEMGVRTVYGINNFMKVVYTLNPLPIDKSYHLIVVVIEKTPIILKGSIHYDNIFGIGIVGNLTLRNLLGKSSRTIIAGDISENPKFRFDYLKYMGIQQEYAFNFRYDFLNEQIPSYDEGLLLDVESSVQHNIVADLISTQSLKNSVSLGVNYQIKHQKQKFNTLIPQGIKYGIFNFFGGNLLFTVNTFNDRNYPTRGRELAVGAQAILSSSYQMVYENGVDSIYFPIEDVGVITNVPISENEFNTLVMNPLTPTFYGKVQFNVLKYFELTRKFQLIPFLNLGVILSIEEDKLFQNYNIGGSQRVRYTDRRFMGLHYAEESWDNFAMGGMLFQNVLFGSLYLKYGVNMLLPYEHVPLDDLQKFSMETLINQNSMLGYGVEATYKSFIGPISLGFSRNSRDSYFRYYFSVGYSFNYAD